MADAGVFGHERGRIELLGGYLFEMPPIGTAHMVVVTRLSMQLHEINAQGRLLVQQPIRVAEFDEPQPDVTVLGAPLGTTKPGAEDCELLIEVADTSVRFDREVKGAAYRIGGVARYWIVNVSNGVVEEYTADGGWHLDIHYPGEHNLSVAGLEIDIQALFRDLPPV